MSAANQDVRALVSGWIDSWNQRDLDGIMAHYAEDVLFEANTVVSRWDRRDGRLHGAAELREHF